nr:Rib/alpha-like domain-containing protein [Lactobacillus sp. ESL0703]
MASDELDTTDSTYRKIYGGKFSDLIFLKDIQGLNNLDTSAATDMSFMFAGDVSLKNIDLSKFDTSNVTNMKYMFAADTSLTSLDLSKFDTSKVTNMNKMFAADISLNDINFGNNFKTDKVENIADSMMFNETPKEARWNSDFGVDQPTTVPTEASQATVSSKGTLTVKVGGSVGEAKDAISGLPDDGSTAEWETPVDTSKEGLQIATVLVTFSDGSTKEVSVLVNVESKSANAPTEASQATVVSKGTLTVKVGDSVGAAKDAISGLPDDGSKAEWKVPVDTSKEGSQIATVVVTFSDGSTEQIPVLVEVKAASSNNGSNSNGSSGSNSGSSSNSSSASSNTTSAPATGSETTKSVIVMHNAYIYDKDHKRVGTKKIGSYTNTTVYGEKTKLNDGTEAYKVGEGQYIDAGNVDGYKVALNHNSYVYKTSKKRANHTKLLKGATVTVYGSSFTFKNGQKYYRIAKGQYIKVVNADIVK